MSGDILKQLTRIANSLENIAGEDPVDTTADIPENWDMTEVTMCRGCGQIIRYSYDDVKTYNHTDNFPDAWAYYIKCPNCGRRLILSRSAVCILREMKEEYEREKEGCE